MRLLSLIIVVALSAVPVFAQEGRFYADISAGAAVFNIESNLYTDSENEEIDSLDADAESISTTMPVLVFDAGYKTKDTTYYIKTPFDEGDYGLAAGVKHDFGEAGDIDVSVFTKLGSEVWENPYVLDRDATDADVAGIDVTYRKIGGTGFELDYALTTISVDEDKAADAYEELDRSGLVHDIKLGYAYSVAPGTAIVPGIRVERGQLEGEAESWQGFGAGLELRRFSKTYFTKMSLNYKKDNFDEENPYFGETREDSSVSGFFMFSYRGFSNKRVSATLLAYYSVSDSEIDFFDSKASALAGVLGYSF
ncbi:DUF2860 family protein [Limisalsivibrio acetivorans]|uniref:DUF2860 family protein n=1 Tax=Limisalsivibrio acetivorans TaxID=1304888 RepID=UPI000427A895|nr:DUF2860 family protein [Limisalsivibrio acetivorans]